MTEKKIWIQDELICKPLNTYEEILSFIQKPPSWRTLCTAITPHSEQMIKNININKCFGNNLLESPQSFCHFKPEKEDVERQDRKTLPKTLVCHDMANGYHDDSFIDGTSNYDAYTFYNWAGIDIFCYFSHHLVTIPPLGWINVGHAHGVKVIGTIITEWKNGVEFWDRILKSELEWQTFVNALVAIAKTLKFDGWLLNIENKINKPEALLQFVRTLHSVLHQELDDAVLLWYDSVTIQGHLHWQNGLNNKNRDFFDAVDGLFTNYSWTENDVRLSSDAAGERLTDLYIGIDVWGRNFHGGGQFNTQQAIQVAHKLGCSLAIFAPAWTHEAIADNDIETNADTDELSKLEQFHLRDRALWCSIWPYLNTKLPCQLPFQTSFCRGQGKRRRLYGEVICPSPWFNLRHMQYQPNSSLGPHGYVLSTRENLLHMSRMGLLKHKDAIKNYRRGIKASKKDIDQEEEESPGSTERGELTDYKRKIKSTLKNLFNTKPSTGGEGSVTCECSDDPMNSSDNESVNESESVIQLSLRLNLGKENGIVRYSLAYVPSELECLEPFYEDSFIGGSCLKVNPQDTVSSSPRFSRIFHCDFSCEKMIVCVVTKTMIGHGDQFLDIELYLVHEEKKYRITLIGRDVPHEPPNELTDLLQIYPLQEPHVSFRDMQSYILLNEPCFYVPIQNSFGWNVRYYEVPLRGSRLVTVCCRTGISESPILLGHFGLCQRT